ncbi:MMPL family transporter [Amycolatopsis sp. H20-H5]|uniref:MMPL family transporter n=1 Tax=Amycolatopsis sp. H20-H5 TaxID=3046309 RepID=UPI002DB9DC70|nr:MMPL family transporter [Amycolatopsis sp. H20-H5]MEC3976434.1 MMPL family transporter [Amycolatopsis sp. H20-H5]
MSLRLANKSTEDPPAPVRRRWLLPALIALAWLVFGVLGASFPGLLSKVQTNDGASFLPASAEATEVAHLQERFAGGKVLPALVIYSRDGGITEPDRAAITRDAAGIAKLGGLSGPVSPPVSSQDGKAVQLVVPVSGVDGFAAGETVKSVREILHAGAPAGLTAAVTGPGGYNADFSEVFGGIDGKLLVITAIAVVLILALVYRSPLLPVVVLATAGLALIAAAAVVYPLASGGALTLNGQSQGILFILVFGASTDYALLLVARYREELTQLSDPRVAVVVALRASVESITASAGTVVLGLLCMLFSELTSNKGLGPVAAIGIGASLLASLTFLPAMLALLGRAAFWPLRLPSKPRDGLWERVSKLVGRRFRTVWVVTAFVLAALAAFAPMLKSTGVSQSDVFLNRVEAVSGQETLARHFPGGAGDPAVIVSTKDTAAQVVAAAGAVDGVAGAQVSAAAGTNAPRVIDGLVEIDATLRNPADSDAAATTVGKLRDAVRAVPGAQAKVGGQTAVQQEINDAAERDRMVIIPIVLLVIFCVLALLLRSLLAPLMLIATVVLSFAATLGVGALVFNDVLGFPGSDPSVPLYAFVFLVALGIDYNIFLMTRVREEARHLGTKAGALKALSVTGGVITSAGVVLAATFAALSVLPILFMAQIAFLVAFGVLLDTLIVRSLLVPALTVHIGRTLWWPGRLRTGAA